jgi:hypothetical protein
MFFVDAPTNALERVLAAYFRPTIRRLRSELKGLQLFTIMQVGAAQNVEHVGANRTRRYRTLCGLHGSTDYVHESSNLFEVLSGDASSNENFCRQCILELKKMLNLSTRARK